MNRNIELTWTDFKQTINDRNLRFQWIVESGNYTLFAQDGFLDLECKIKKQATAPAGSDQEDFENNYKSKNNNRVGQHTYSSDDRLLVDSRQAPTAANLQVEELARDSNGNASLEVDGSTTTQVFTIEPDSNKDKLINTMSFVWTGGFSWPQFLQLAGLTNGILVELKANDNTFTYRPIKETQNFLHDWAKPASGFKIERDSSSPSVAVEKTSGLPFRLKKQGTFSTDDFIKIKVRDDLTGATGDSAFPFHFIVAGIKE